jgi:hypothetical protein
MGVEDMSGLIVGWLIAGIGVVLAVLGIRNAANVRRERDELKLNRESIDAMAKRLVAAREAAKQAANQKPVDPKRRDDFEGQP